MLVMHTMHAHYSTAPHSLHYTTRFERQPRYTHYVHLRTAIPPRCQYDTTMSHVHALLPHHFNHTAYAHAHAHAYAHADAHANATYAYARTAATRMPSFYHAVNTTLHNGIHSTVTLYYTNTPYAPHYTTREHHHYMRNVVMCLRICK